MKLATENNFVLSNSNNEKTFGIVSSAKAFKILSSSLYERKIEAIIRELSCNAKDSHDESGKSNIPFHIHLPTTWEPEFSVEDFGLGMDEDEMENVFSNYFASTKTHTNSLIGGLGLGSKSPFSYTDTFTIRARKNGIELLYNAYFNDKGEPSLSLMSKAETEECNGLKIIVPVRASDFYEFKSAAKKVFKWFPITPVFVGEEVNIDNSDIQRLDEKGYFLTNYGSYNKNFIDVVMSTVCYRVNNFSSIFANDFTKSELHFFENNGLTIRFNVGELDVNPSRETISFDETTKETFINRVKDILYECNIQIQKEIDSTGSIIEACSYVSESIGEWALGLFNYNEINLLEYGHENFVDIVYKIFKHFKVDNSYDFYSKNRSRIFAYNDYLQPDKNKFIDLSNTSKKKIGFIKINKNARNWKQFLGYECKYWFKVYSEIDNKMVAALDEEFGDSWVYVDGDEQLQIAKEKRKEAARLNRLANKTPSIKTPRIKKNEFKINFYYDYDFDTLTKGSIKDEKIITEEELDSIEKFTVLKFLRGRYYTLDDRLLFNEKNVNSHQLTHISILFKINKIFIVDNQKCKKFKSIDSKQNYVNVMEEKDNHRYDNLYAFYMMIIYKNSFDNNGLTAMRKSQIIFDKFKETLFKTFPYIEVIHNNLIMYDIYVENIFEILFIHHRIFDYYVDKLNFDIKFIENTIKKRYELLDYLSYGVDKNMIKRYIAMVDHCNDTSFSFNDDNEEVDEEFSF